MAPQKDPELPSTHGHTKSIAIYGMVPMEKIAKISQAASTTKDKKETCRQVGETEM